MPKMIGVQASQCAPIYNAFAQGLETVSAWDFPIQTIAGGIADPLIGYADDGTLTLRKVGESKGLMTYLTEEEIYEGMTAIEQKVGLYCEPAGAVSVGAVKKLWADGVLPRGCTVVSMMTGSGFKYSGRLAKKPPLIQTIEQAVDRLKCSQDESERRQ